MNRESLLSAEKPSENLPPVEAQQERTRDSVFRAVGKTAEFSLDASAFALKAAGYGVGRTVRAVAQTTQAAAQGIMGKPFTIHP